MNNPQFTLRVKREDLLEKASLWPSLINVIGAFVVLIFLVLPLGINLKEKIQSSRALEKNLQKIETKNQEIKTQITIKEAEKREKGQKMMEEEKMILPEKIEVAPLASILEILSLQFENLDIRRASHFDLRSIRFEDKNADSLEGQRASLSFSTDYPNLKAFIDYLEKGLIPPLIEEGVKGNFIPENIIKVFQTQKLPLAQIENLEVSAGEENYLNVEMKVLFHKKSTL